jgi:phosphoribosylformylglycinamidine cyclo-ligase
LDAVENSPIDAGQLVLSPTRTYAPIIKKILDQYSSNEIHGMVHCSGGAQTKILHFVEKLHIIRQFISSATTFQLIQEQSQIGKKCIKFLIAVTEWKFTFRTIAQDIIEISKSFNVDAQIVGRVGCHQKN